MKHIIWSIVTLSSILLINWGLTTKLNADFMEYAFLTGVGITALTWFFNSSGGMTSNTIRMETQAKTGIKIEEEKQRFSPKTAFFTSLIYTLVAGIVTIFYYF
jgi:hypothetical protein